MFAIMYKDLLIILSHKPSLEGMNMEFEDSTQFDKIKPNLGGKKGSLNQAVEHHTLGLIAHR